MSKNDSISKGSGIGAAGSMEELKKIFNKFDKNGDGRISCDELRGIFGELGSETASLEEVQRIMAEFDKDGDGHIDIAEFAEIINGGSTKELRDAFDLYDLDKNGLISKSELHEVLKRLGQKCSLKECAKMIGSVDADGDGHVNFAEFKKMMTRK
ncbi:calcium-binding protein CML23 [Pyrus ussuriensis x Pyrus communis]|uniref:Calcium-binding protein CML23 n=1 Tax=Pyrus ussuriensis x Pyrus communis TaxID=2448454 RepID=A0A5N5GAC1_9ROSA|nr:calcium-binding protein CML23 [Pyrus ussuriensis x Pyrus communis]KAB2612384.1 calcium-binding protein CML23 [Pyrus ussuriensis x Pyrus communis]KAB2612389.1 calcium-binding protein CML23 [Pyrus ussuriensis x Pyrus communis]